MNFIKLILYAALGVVLFYVGVLVYHTIWDWKPAQVLPVATSHPRPSDEDESLEFLIWNVGFGGLGAETSFFYDGGETVIPDEAWTYKNEQGIRDVLKKHQHVEFVLLQEVDSLARRSHWNNQIRTFHTALNRHSASFALNYNVAYVPLPIFNGMGEVRSGLASYSRLATHNNQRHAFDTQFEWPRQVFFLDRCFLVQHAQWQGKEIVVINTHCSAYDETGEFVAAEIQKMIHYGQEQVAQGKYVIIGGDWNQCPPGYEPIKARSAYNEHLLTDEQIPEGWKWVSDITTPTNRKLDHEYNGFSYTSCIDHYLVSPGVVVEKVKVIDTDFQFSDHQPVYLRVHLD